MHRIATTVVLVLALVACGQTRRPDGGSGLLPVGAKAPELVGEDAAGKPIKLSDARGKIAVVYFYPKDGTPGCTTQACAFRDAWGKLQAAGIVVFGVSRDSAESHRAFRAEHALPFPLVSDESGEVAAAYGVPSKFVVLTERVTFLVDPEGNIVRVWPEVDPAVDATRVQEAATEISGEGPAS